MKHKNIKTDHLSTIKKFLQKNLSKISLPFLNKNKNIIKDGKTTVELLPKLIKKDKKQENYTKKPEQKTQNTNTIFFPKTNKLKYEIQPMLLVSKIANIQNKKENNQPIKQILSKTEQSNEIFAKFEPNAVKAGGKDGPKLTILHDKDKVKQKELALVGENEPEKIIKSSNIVVPLTKLSKKEQDIKTTKENVLKSIKTTPSSINRVLQPLNANNNFFVNSNLAKTVVNSLQKLNVLPIKNKKIEKKPLKIKTTNGKFSVNVSQQDKKEILPLLLNNQISNKLSNEQKTENIISVVGYAEGKNLNKLNIEQPKQNQNNLNIIKPQNNMSELPQTKIPQPNTYLNEQFLSKSTQIKPIESENLSNKIDSPKQEKQQSQSQSSNVNSNNSTTDKNESSSTSTEPMTINNSPTNIPVSVVNNNFEYDIFRMTSDYAQMLPEWRLRVG